MHLESQVNRRSGPASLKKSLLQHPASGAAPKQIVRTLTVDIPLTSTGALEVFHPDLSALVKRSRSIWRRSYIKPPFYFVIGRNVALMSPSCSSPMARPRFLWENMKRSIWLKCPPPPPLPPPRLRWTDGWAPGFGSRVTDLGHR